MPDAVSIALWVPVTLLVYLLAARLYGRWRWSVLHPTLVSIVLLIAVLRLAGISYSSYEPAGRVLGMLLGPGVVALGVPLALHWDAVVRQRRALGLAVAAGSVVGIAAAAGSATLLGADPAVVRTLVARSVTTPIAVEIARTLGGIPSLAAAVSVGSGVFGAVAGPALLSLLGVTRTDSWGFALGAAAHGIGTARAAERSPEAAAAAGLAIGLMGLATGGLAALLAWMLG